jgi:hypothetical protein
MGLSPAALRFVTRVADADVVLHVKPAKKQRHYQYEEVGVLVLAAGLYSSRKQYLNFDPDPDGGVWV